MRGFTRDGVKESRKVVKSSWGELVGVDQVEGYLVNMMVILVILVIVMLMFVFIIVRSIRTLSQHFHDSLTFSIHFHNENQ